MEKEKVLNELQHVIQDQLTHRDSHYGDYIPPLPKPTDVLSHICMDSFDIMEVTLKIEESLGIEIADEEWATLAERQGVATVNDFVDIIMSHYTKN
ncbi:MAG: hypothetical protein IJ019_02450 [Alphaproteobacteria bacterium]|nr:hypothetical protein [Alphaproteobacteria bacterium]